MNLTINDPAYKVRLEKEDLFLRYKVYVNGLYVDNLRYLDIAKSKDDYTFCVGTAIEKYKAQQELREFPELEYKDV